MDVEYLMKEIGEPLTEAMASLVDCRCHDAVEYIGYYLLNYVERENNMVDVFYLSDFIFISWKNKERKQIN